MDGKKRVGPHGEKMFEKLKGLLSKAKTSVLHGSQDREFPRRSVEEEKRSEMKGVCLLFFWPDSSDGEFSRDFFIKDSIVEGTWTNCARMCHERGSEPACLYLRCEQELGPK